jgi:hypothetical protein
MTISVLYWGSHPDKDNDDCYSGQEYDTEKDAVAAYMVDPTDRSIEYIEIDLCRADLIRLGITRCRKSGNFVPSKDTDDGEWKRENAMQAGMAFGVHGYNDAMGYDSEEYVPESYR